MLISPSNCRVKLERTSNSMSFLDFTRNYEQTSGNFVPCVCTGWNMLTCSQLFVHTILAHGSFISHRAHTNIIAHTYTSILTTQRTMGLPRLLPLFPWTNKNKDQYGHYIWTSLRENLSLGFVTRPTGYNTFAMLGSLEHEIYNLHKYQITNKKETIFLLKFFKIYDHNKYHAHLSLA